MASNPLEAVVLDLDGILIEGEDWDAIRERLVVSGEADGFRAAAASPG